MRREAFQFLMYVFVVVVIVIGIAMAGPVDAADPEPSFAPDVQPSPICGLYPGWEPGDAFGVGPGDVIECPPDEFPVGPQASGRVPLRDSTRSTPIVVGVTPDPTQVPLPETDAAP